MYKIVEQSFREGDHHLLLQLGDDTTKRLVVMVPQEDPTDAYMKYLYSKPQTSCYPIYGLNLVTDGHYT